MSGMRRLRRKVIMEVGGKALWTLERAITKTSRVPTTPFLDPRRFEWIEPLEQQWRTIRGELDAVLADGDRIPNFQDISTDQVAITQDSKWKTFFLYGFGYRAEANCARCPETTRLLEEIPGMTTGFFSILYPGKHIPEHRGLYRGFLRYHLGVKIPEPASSCGIRVGEETAHWEEGKSLMFDDTYPHEAWNRTDGIRVVLFVDVIRPLTFLGSLLNRAVIAAVKHSPYVQDARRNQVEWERRYDRLQAHG